MKVFKNLLPVQQQDYLENIVNHDEFPWFFYGNVIYDRNEKFEKHKNITETYAWIHTLYFQPKGANSEFFDRFKIILDAFAEKQKVKITEMLRVRIRRTFYCKGHTLKKYNYPHVDLADLEKYKSLVYYLHDSDGDTIMFKEKHNKDYPNFYDKTKLTIAKKNTPKKGSALYFDGDTYHAGNSPVEYTYRTVVNFDFRINE